MSVEPSAETSALSVSALMEREFRDRYAVLRELRAGGSGARVFLVQPKDNEKGPLAVLKYFDARGGVPERVGREKRAVELAAAAGRKFGLILEHHLGRNSFWYVMPYFDGESLDARVAREADLAAPSYVLSALDWMVQLLTQVQALHQVGVVHKDIKPSNLIVDGARLQLIDIGLLIAVDSDAPLTGSGTEYYRDRHMDTLEREQKRVKEANPKAFDLYAAGGVLYFLFEGADPLDGGISVFSGDVPLCVEHVMRRAMAPGEERYPHAGAMLEDLRAMHASARGGGLSELAPAELRSSAKMR